MLARILPTPAPEVAAIVISSVLRLMLSRLLTQTTMVRGIELVSFIMLENEIVKITRLVD